jgi:toxin secretion/phage lysis holin
MKAIMDKLELAFAAVGGVVGWFLGGFDGILYALVVFVVMDYLTGVLAAGVRKELSSEVGFKGIAKKVCIFVLVGIANIVDSQVIHDGAAIRTAVIFFYLANEGISVLENSAVIGLPIPEKLKEMLLQLTEEEHPQGGEDTGTPIDETTDDDSNEE